MSTGYSNIVHHRVDTYAVKIFALLNRLGVIFSHFPMNDGGLSIEWPRMAIVIYPPDEDSMDCLEVVVHNLATNEIAEFLVPIDSLSIQQLIPLLR